MRALIDTSDTTMNSRLLSKNRLVTDVMCSRPIHLQQPHPVSIKQHLSDLILSKAAFHAIRYATLALKLKLTCDSRASSVITV